MSEGKGTSPWVWVGVGCAVVVALAVAGTAVVGYFGYRTVKRLEAEQKDPEARVAKAREVLGAESLPEGYGVVVSFSIPFVMDVAVLSDRKAEKDGQIHGFDHRGFVFVRVLSAGRDQQQLRDYFEGRSDDSSVLTRNNIRIRAREVLEKGKVSVAGQDVLYLVQRGETSFQGESREGLTTLMLAECGTDSRLRFGIWFGEDPHPEEKATPALLAGTVGDPDALRDFLGHFHFCPR
jgi:hypothetical protein